VKPRIALDVHAHLAPAIPAGARDVEVAARQLFDPEALRAWMQKHGVAQAWVSVPPPLYRPQLDEGASREWFLYVNESLASFSGGGLRPLFHLPLEHPALALELASRFGDGAGFSVPAGGENVACFSDARLNPLWEHLDARQSFVFVHPGSCCDGRLAPFYLENLLGNPHETTLAIAHLVFSGLRARCPRIRFCFAHGGGAAAMLAGRWQRGFDTARPGVERTLPPPREVLRTLYVDSIVHDPAALAQAAAVFGAGRILFGSDWPFPMGLPDPHEQLAGVDAGLRDLIFAAGRILE